MVGVEPAGRRDGEQNVRTRYGAIALVDHEALEREQPWPVRVVGGGRG